MPVNDEALRRTVAELLSTRVVSRDALVDELVAREVDLGRDDRRLNRLLQMDTTFAEVGDGEAGVERRLAGTARRQIGNNQDIGAGGHENNPVQQGDGE